LSGEAGSSRLGGNAHDIALLWSITAKLLKDVRAFILFEDTSLRICRTGNLRAVVNEGMRAIQKSECIVERVERKGREVHSSGLRRLE